MPVLVMPGFIAGATFLVIWIIRREFLLSYFWCNIDFLASVYLLNNPYIGYRKGSTKTNSPPPSALPKARECGPVASTKPNLTPAPPLGQPRLYAQESQQYSLVASNEPDLTPALLGPPPLYAQQSQQFSTIVVSSETDIPQLLVQCCPPDGDRGLTNQYYAGQEFDLGGHDKDSDSD